MAAGSNERTTYVPCKFCVVSDTTRIVISVDLCYANTLALSGERIPSVSSVVSAKKGGSGMSLADNVKLPSRGQRDYAIKNAIKGRGDTQ